MSDSRYDLILADPPWRYDFSRSKSREVERKYPTMTVPEICALDVASLTPGCYMPVRVTPGRDSRFGMWEIR